MQAPSVGRTKRRELRRDLQGLRAVAVIAVVAQHLTGYPRGGFVGVDVFFVLSGYLITGILLRGLGDLGPRRWLAAFYRRRVRRILPAAVVVIALTVLAAHQVFAPQRFATTRTDAWWSLAFSANWHLIDVDTNYFTAGAPVSPLQHFWSLAVEEQFYLVWPVLMLFVALSVRGRARRVGIGVAAFLTSAVSFALAAVQSTTAPTTAYFSSFTRGWELGLGALLVCLPAPRLSRAAASALSWAGVALIGASLVLTGASTGMPVPGAVLPCLGAALVIVAVGHDGREPRSALLTNRVAVATGDLSYSLYLAHFPVIVLLAAAMSDHGGYYKTAAVLLTVGSACALYALVERPVLASSWLVPQRTAGERPVHTRRWTLVALLATSAAVAAIALQPDEAALLRTQYRAANSAPERGAASLPLELATLQRRIATALHATAYPALHPTMAAATSGDFATPRIIACGQNSLAPIASCTVGPASATHTLYVTGDSTSAVYAEALTVVVAAMPGWRLVIRSGFGCPFSSVVYRAVDDTQSGCGTHNDLVVREINHLRPAVLVVTNEHRAETPAGASGPITVRDQVGALGTELNRVRGAVGTIAIVAPPPGGADLPDCYRPGSAPVRCVVRPSPTWLELAAAERALAHHDHDVFVDPRTWFCSPAGYCPSFVGDVPTMYDGTHATRAYMHTIAPAIAESLARAGVLPRPKRN